MVIFYLVSVCMCVMLTTQAPIASFDFSSSQFEQSNLTFTDGIYDIQLHNSNQYNSEREYIRIDGDNQADFITLLNFTSYEYFVSMWIYIYEDSYKFNPFCVRTIGEIEEDDRRNLNSTHKRDLSTILVESEVHWCTSLQTSDPNTLYKSAANFIDGDSNDVNYGVEGILNFKPTGWQYVGFYHNPSNSTYISGTISDHKYFGFNTNSLSEPLADIPYSAQIYGVYGQFGTGTIGYSIDSNGDKQRIFNGIISQINVHEGIPSTDEIGFRNELLGNLDLYDAYWDFSLSSNNGIEDNFVINEGYDSTGTLSGQYFSQIGISPPIPTNMGWAMLDHYNGIIQSPPLNLQNSSSFTLEFEMFSFYTYPNVYIYLHPNSSEFESNKGGYLRFILTHYWNYLYSPYTYTYNFRFTGYRWTKIYISVELLVDTTKMNVCFYKRDLDSHTGPGRFDYDNHCFVNLDSATFPFFEELVVSFQTNDVIIKNFKLYKYAFNGHTVVSDLGPYRDPMSDNSNYNFASNFWNNYRKKFYYHRIGISHSLNSCMNYLTPISMCRDMDQAKYEYCPSGFVGKNIFCTDKCGDGIVQENPQVLGCDDGNKIIGDGCNSLCQVEDDYYCIIYSGKSICYRKCGNGILEDNEQCDDGNEIDGDGCDYYCNIEYRHKCQTTIGPSDCYPFCGDGIRDPGEECDDKNNMNYDGCTQSCEKEFNYDCDIDLVLGKDVCYSINFPPVVIIDEIVFEENKAMFIFNDTMQRLDLTNDDVILDFSGPNGPYSVSWSSKFSSDNTLEVEFSISPTPIPGIGEQLSIELLNIDKFKSFDTLPIATSIKFEYNYEDLDADASVDTAGSSASYTFVATVCLTILVSILTGGSMEQMWSLTNTLQIIFYFSMMNLYYPPNLLAILQYMSYSNLDNPATAWLGSKILGGFHIISSPVAEEFEVVGLESNNILVNSLDKLIFLILLIIMILIFAGLFKCLKKQSNCFAKFVKKVDGKLRYESTSRFLVELCMSLFVSAFVNITYGDRSGNTLSAIAYVIAVILVVCMIIILVYCIVYPIYYHRRLITHPDKNERHAMIFVGFKRHKLKCLLYYAYFILRRMGLAATLVCLKDFPHIQCVCIAMLCVWICNYHFFYRPYTDQLINFLSCFNELILVSFTILLFFFLDSSDAQKLNRAGYAGIAILALFFLVNWSIIFPLKFWEFYVTLKRWCSKKKKKPKIKWKPRIPKNQNDMVEDFNSAKESNKNYVIEKIYYNNEETKHNKTSKRERKLANFESVIKENNKPDRQHPPVGKKFDEY